jgi:hypothetical protein
MTLHAAQIKTFLSLRTRVNLKIAAFNLLHSGVLFARKVDLIMEGAPKNPYFIKDIDESRQLLYAA